MRLLSRQLKKMPFKRKRFVKRRRYRRKGRRSYRKGGFKKRRFNRRRGTRTRMTHRGFGMRRQVGTVAPNRMRIKLTATDRFSTPITFFIPPLATTATREYRYSGNNIWDPYFDAGGQTVRNWSWLSNMYQYYRVYGSVMSVKVQFEDVLPSATQVPYSQQLVLAWHRDGNFWDGGGADELNYYYEGLLLQPCQVHTGMKSSKTSKQMRLRKYMTDRKCFGEQLEESNFVATMTSNPVSPWFWLIVNHVQQGHINGALETTLLSASYEVRVTYYTELFGRRMSFENTNAVDARIENGFIKGNPLLAAEKVRRTRITNVLPMSTISETDEKE